MATRYMSILGPEWLPNASGVSVRSYSEFATNDVWDATVVESAGRNRPTTGACAA
jgi:hypothetical protein